MTTLLLHGDLVGWIVLFWLGLAIGVTLFVIWLNRRLRRKRTDRSADG